MHNKYDAILTTDAEILRRIEAVDKKKRGAEGRDRKKGKFTPSAASAAGGRSAPQTAKKLGIGRAKVERARVVLLNPEETAAVLSGEKTIHHAWKDIMERRQSQRIIKNGRVKLKHQKPAPVIGAKKDILQRIVRHAQADLRVWQEKYAGYKELPELAEIFSVLERMNAS